MPPPRRRNRPNAKPIGQPPTKKEKAAQMKKIFESSLNGDIDGVLEVLNAWKDLQVSTTARYLLSEDPDGETAYQLSQRGYRMATTRYKDDEKAERCKQIQHLLLCASHQTVPVALKIWDWERSQQGQRFYGPDAHAPFQKDPTDPYVNEPLTTPEEFHELGWTRLHAAAHTGDIETAIEAMQHGGDPLLPDKLGHTPRALAIFGPRFEVPQLKKDEDDVWPSEKSIDAPILEGDENENDDNDDDGGQLRQKTSSDDGSVGSHQSISIAKTFITKEVERPKTPGDPPPQDDKVSTNLMAEMLLTSSWLNVEEVMSEMAAGQRRKLNAKRLDQALEAAALSAAREKLWWNQAAADNFGRVVEVPVELDENGNPIPVPTEGEVAADADDKKGLHPITEQGSGGGVAAGGHRGNHPHHSHSNKKQNHPEETQQQKVSTGSDKIDNNSKDKQNSKGKGRRATKTNSVIEQLQTQRIHPNSWVAQAQAWAPTAIKWGESVANLYKGTATSVMLEEINLSKRRVKVDHLPRNETGPLSRAIGHNTFITHLDLSNLNLQDKGAKNLANAIVFNNKLEALILDKNDIGDEGARALSFGLTAHKQDYLRNISLVDNKIGDDGALMLLFYSWTIKCKVEDFATLKPAEILPMDKEDLITINLQNNKVEEPIRLRLEAATEAIFIMRDPRETAAITIQRFLRKKLKAIRDKKFAHAARVIQHVARYVWIPKIKMIERVQQELLKTGFDFEIAVKAAIKATKFYVYEPPPKEDEDDLVDDDGVNELVSTATTRSRSAVELADPGAYRKKERQRRRRILEAEAYKQRTIDDFRECVAAAKGIAEDEVKPRKVEPALQKPQSFQEF